MAYAATEVQVERSQGEIRKLLYAHDAANFSFSERSIDGVQWASVEFVLHDQLVRVQAPLKGTDAKTINDKVNRSRTKTKAQIEREMSEQEARRIWRVLYHGLKARLVSVEEGVETFEQAFLAHLVDPITRQTLWDATKSLIESGVLRLGGVGIEIGPPQLGSPVSTARDRITSDDIAASDDVVDAVVVG